MIHKCILIIFAITLTSCATVMTRRNYKVAVSSNANNAKVKILDSTYHLPANIRMQRSKKDLQLQLISDTLMRSFLIKTSPNPAFLYGNLLWMQVSPVAYLIDFTNQKRFYYGKSVYLNTNDTNTVLRPPVSKVYYDYYSKTYPTHKGQINFVLSLPWINSFYLQPEHESSKSNTGFWGISAGVEYFYKDNKYLSMSGHGASDFFIPVPATVDISGEYEMMSTIYLSFTDNYKFRRFTMGYGVNYSKNIWDFRYYDRFDPPPLHLQR